MSRKASVLLLGICVLMVAPSATPLLGAPASAKPNAGQITFELKYRGLTGAKGEPRVGFSWGFGSSNEPQSPFTKSLNLPKEKVIYIPRLPLLAQAGNESALALELDGDKSVALYVDLNGDGKLSPNEKILPSKEKSPRDPGTLYVTPDFKVKTKNGKESPYRLFLIDGTYSAAGGKVRHSPEFSPACLWEGAGVMDGKPFHLVLLDNDFDGQFTQFGQDGCALMPEAEYAKALESGYLPRERLSRLVPIGQQFYTLRMETTPDGAQPARAVLTKSESPLGKIALELKGSEGMKAVLTSLYLCGREGDTFFNLAGKGAIEQALPVGSYLVENGAISYGSANPEEWLTDFSSGPEITVSADASCLLKLGQPKLTPSVVKRQDRYRPDAKPGAVFKKGDDIYCSPEVKGMASEKYRSFSRMSGDKVPDPTIRIVDANGKEVASASISMPYGSRGSGLSWKTQNVEPGKYTVLMTVETGPLAGKLEGKTEITIE